LLESFQKGSEIKTGPARRMYFRITNVFVLRGLIVNNVCLSRSFFARTRTGAPQDDPGKINNAARLAASKVERRHVFFPATL
jgi:hypothetical protein